jgi:hypothetical protein
MISGIVSGVVVTGVIAACAYYLYYHRNKSPLASPYAAAIGAGAAAVSDWAGSHDAPGVAGDNWVENPLGEGVKA